MKEEILRGTLVMYKEKPWSVVKHVEGKMLEIWRNGERIIVKISEVEVIG